MPPLKTFLSRASWGATLLAMAASLATPPSASAFAGVAAGCTDLASSPDSYTRHRSEAITFRISDNFKARYPDAFAQYLVEDSARWWQDSIGGFQWSADIHSRFSYLRQDESQVLYELKTVLLHEFGHAMGMQHSDACYYNTNSNTGMPWESNFRLIGGGNAAVEPTIGPELMNEAWAYSSPGQKVPGSPNGYNRSIGLDGFEFLAFAYPFQPLTLTPINSGTPVILVDSTDAGSSGGQTTFLATSQIVSGDSSQGRYIDGINIWVGNSIDVRSRSDSWSITNNSGADIRQLTLWTEGSSTRRPVFESSPSTFTHFGMQATSSPEQMIAGWSTDPGDSWSDGATGTLSLELDVHDWTLLEALMWENPGSVFPLPLVATFAIRPWKVTTPTTPPPGVRPGFKVSSTLPSEPTPGPQQIEMKAATEVTSPDGPRAVRVFVPEMEGLAVESLELLPLSWAEAELLRRQPATAREGSLRSRFSERPHEVQPIVKENRPGSQDYQSPEKLGFKPFEPHYDAVTESGGQRPPQPTLLALTTELSLDARFAYALRTVTSTPNASVTTLSLPEMDTYPGIRTARCSLAADVANCCPYEMTNPITLDSAAWSAQNERESTCVVGSDLDEEITLGGDYPHLLATGNGDDTVVAERGESIVLLGEGADVYKADSNAQSHVNAGAGNDTLLGSDRGDSFKGEGGDDTIIALMGNDLIDGGAGSDNIEAGDGDDTIYPGSGNNSVDAGRGDDQVIFTDLCELRQASILDGGQGKDTLVLPTSEAAALQMGLVHVGFEHVVENADRDSRFADCR